MNSSNNPEMQSLNPNTLIQDKALCHTLFESHSTLHSSRIAKSPHPGKFYSFKKIKESRIREQNQHARIMHQTIIRKESRQKKRLKTLDDAKSILSHSSSPSSSYSKCILDQSIIVFRGRELREANDLQEPLTPFFKNSDNLAGKKNSQKERLKIIKQSPAILRCRESGIICHFQMLEVTEGALEQIDVINSEALLQIYSATSIPSHKNMSLVLYEPFTQTLLQYAMSTNMASFPRFISYCSQVIKILSVLASSSIFPTVDSSSVVLKNGNLKVKIRPSLLYFKESETEALHQCGYYFDLLLEKMSLACFESKKKIVEGFTREKKSQLKSLIAEFFREEGFTLKEAYVRLQALNY